MQRLIEFIDRHRQRSARDGTLIQVLEPAYQMLAVHRGAFSPTLRFVAHHGLGVGGGPFAGMRYPGSAPLRVPGLVAYLAGTYELELHQALESLLESHPDLIVNIGAGDGYYAVGMARRCQQARVIAYEADPYRARICRQLARLNDVDDRIDQGGVCTPDELAALRPPPNTVVIADCEGAERQLIDPGRAPWLRHARLLIEVHEVSDPDLPGELEERLEGSHSVELIAPGKRYVWDPEYAMGWRAGLSPAQQEMVMAELRPVRTPWLWAVPSS